MESPLRFYYLVELNLDNENTNDFPFISLFGGKRLAYSMISSTFFKTQRECIIAIDALSATQYKILTDKNPDSFFGITTAFNTQFAKSTNLYVDEETGMAFEPDEIYRSMLFDAIENEPIVTITMQVSDLGSDDSIYFSGEVH